jgi:trehalose-phosphatase
LKIIKKQVDICLFFKSVKEANERILLLDYDGTLAPFNINRDEAVPYAGIEDVIDKIMDSETTRVVIISGRRIKDLLKLIKFKRRPEIWGSHGWERMMPNNTYHIEKIQGNALKALTCVEDWLRAEGLAKLCEPKPSSIALHWRGFSQIEVEDLHRKVDEHWHRIPHVDELQLTGFDGGLEIRVPGKNKGHAVKKILSETDTNSAVAYLGDDKTDEDAFKALGDTGLCILVREELRPSRADIWLKPPEELLSFLDEWLNVCREVRRPNIRSVQK